MGVLRLEVLVFAVSLLAKRAELSKPFLLVFSRLKSGFRLADVSVSPGKLLGN